MVMCLGFAGVCILLLLLKLLKTGKDGREQRTVLTAMAAEYRNLYLVDLKKNLVHISVAGKETKEIISCSKNSEQILQRILLKNVEKEYEGRMKEFTDLNSLADRMKGKKQIWEEYIEKNQGWIRAYFLVAACDKNERPVKVIFASKNIEQQKRKEERLMVESYTDEMTGCFNRRAYEEDIHKLSMERDFAYVLVDVNGLKMVNDTLGHSAGDELIGAAASSMKKSFGSLGKVYRIGGDEFAAVILTKSRTLEKMKTEFMQCVNQWEGKQAKSLSVSCGIAFSREKDWKSVEEMAKEADSRMYQEKAVYYGRKGTDRRRRL